jgi:hypothetical protein
LCARKKYRALLPDLEQLDSVKNPVSPEIVHILITHIVVGILFFSKRLLYSRGLGIKGDSNIKRADNPCGRNVAAPIDHPQKRRPPFGGLQV